MFFQNIMCRVILMKFVKKNSGVLLSFVINLLFNAEWAIPAVILFVLHFVFDISLWWAFGALCFWIALVFFRTLLLFVLNKAGNMPEPYRENKNPYSNKGYHPFSESDNKKDSEN